VRNFINSIVTGVFALGVGSFVRGRRWVMAYLVCSGRYRDGTPLYVRR
jgi:hypothetical protein